MRVYLDGERREVPIKKFSAGESHMNVSHLPRKVTKIGVVCEIKDTESIMAIILLCEALSAWCIGTKEKTLYLNYMPYSRQDRRCAEGDPFSLLVMAKVLKIVNDMGYAIVTRDMHSSCGLGILRSQGVNITNIDSGYEFLSQNIQSFNGFSLVAPDKGATRRVKHMAQDFSLPFVQGEKVRDPATGKLSGFRIASGEVKDRPLLMVDDICDGGGTFIGLAEVLKNAGASRVELYVTHGIFSKGLTQMEQVIDKIYSL